MLDEFSFHAEDALKGHAPDFIVVTTTCLSQLDSGHTHQSSHLLVGVFCSARGGRYKDGGTASVVLVSPLHDQL